MHTVSDVPTVAVAPPVPPLRTRRPGSPRARFTAPPAVAAPVGFLLDGRWITDCPYCGAPMGSRECCGLSTDDAYNAAVVGSAGGDIFVARDGTATLAEAGPVRRLPHALKGGAR